MIDEDAFSAEEAKELRQLLRRIGEQRFLDRTIRNETYTAKKLITAFGIRPVGNFRLHRFVIQFTELTLFLL